jgi:hypothetical protein
MAAEFIMRLDGQRLAPASALDAELMGVLPVSKDLRVVVTVAKDARSVKQNNLRWKVCETIAENIDGDWTKEAVCDVLKIATGHFEPRQTPDGQYFRVPKPTDFGAMGSAEFSAWLDRAFSKASDLFGEALSEAVRNELTDMIAGISPGDLPREEAA